MYDIIHTDAYILNDREDGEESKVFLIFSRELGVCSVHAQAVRKQASKLKSLLQPGNRVFMDVVVGKKMKRATSVLAHTSFLSLFEEQQKRFIFINTLSFLTQLIPRNTPVPEIFEQYDIFIEQLKKSNHEKEIEYIESLFVLNVLSLLGYVDTTKEYIETHSLEQKTSFYKNQINKVLKSIHV